MNQARGFGVAAGLDPEVAAELAGRCEELGYTSMWANDHPAASGLETLAAFAEGSAADPARGRRPRPRPPPAGRHQRQDRGARPRSLPPPDRRRRRLLEEAADADARGPRRAARGDPRGPADPRRDGAEDVRPRRQPLRRRLLQLDDPRLRRRARAKVEAGAAEAGRDAPRVYGYVRTSVGADAETRLAKEEGFYRDLHDGYRNHFERLAEPPGTVGVAAEDPDDADAMLDAYEALDTVVVRGLASATFEAMDRVATAASGQ